MDMIFWYALCSILGLNGGWWITLLVLLENKALSVRLFLWALAMVLNFAIVIALGALKPMRLLMGNEPLYGIALGAIFFMLGRAVAKAFSRRKF